MAGDFDVLAVCRNWSGAARTLATHLVLRAVCYSGVEVIHAGRCARCLRVSDRAILAYEFPRDGEAPLFEVSIDDVQFCEE